MGEAVSLGLLGRDSCDKSAGRPVERTSCAMTGVWALMGKSCSRQHTTSHARKNAGTRQWGRNGTRTT